MAGHFAGKMLVLVLVLGAAQGNGIWICHWFISGGRLVEGCCKIMVIFWEEPSVSSIMNSGSF